jgi:osmotically-inducible protein OsmY
VKTDKQLQRDVLDELQYEPSVDASKIGVIAHNGIVSLTGTVASYAEQNAARLTLLNGSPVSRRLPTKLR